MGSGLSIVFNSTTDEGVYQLKNTRMMRNIILIWLDKNINDKNQHYNNIINQLCSVINTVHTFTDDKKCIEFMKTITDKKIYMITSGAYGVKIVSHIHYMSQVESIFIFCTNKSWHENWARDWCKIKGVFTQISPICELIRKTLQQDEENAISISFMGTNENLTNQSFNQLDPTFIYTQILKEILLTIEFDQQYIIKFIDHCRRVFGDNANELKNADKLEEKKYSDETPIWWYTYESFLYSMLNNALRAMDVDVIIKMGFFISDLHRQIEQLHRQEFSNPHANQIFTVYRGQGLLKIYFDQLLKTKGNLMSFNNFLSTSKDCNVSLRFATNALVDPNSIGILFIMRIDPSKLTTPFASINGFSCFQAENEVLFSMHTIFRIGDIEAIDENARLFKVHLTLISNDDKDLHTLTDCIRSEIHLHSNGWYRLGQLLLRMGQSDKAQQVFEALLENENDDKMKEALYHQIGSAKDNQGAYKDAIIFYEKALEIRKKTHSSNHSSLAPIYSNMGMAYHNMGQYSNAISYHEKAIKIREQSLSSDHPHLAASYNNIANVYYNMRQYSKVLAYHNKALEIKQKILPPNHPDLATSYNNIGNVYRKMNEYETALSYHQKALQIRQQSLPHNHPELATSNNNIGLVYLCMGKHLEALWAHERAIEIRQQCLHPNHPDLATSYHNISEVYEIMGDCLQAYSFCQRAIDIGQRSLSPNHPNLKFWQRHLEDIKRKL